MSSAKFFASPTTPSITATNSSSLKYKHISFNLKAFLLYFACFDVEGI